MFAEIYPFKFDLKHNYIYNKCPLENKATTKNNQAYN